MAIALVNDGTMRWSGADDDYTDRSGMPLSALGMLLAINLVNYETGWINFTKGLVEHRDAWAAGGSPEAEALIENKVAGAEYAWRFLVRSKALGARRLTVTGTPVMTAINALHDDWITLPESVTGAHVPVVELGSRPSNRPGKTLPTFRIAEVIAMPPAWCVASTPAPSLVAAGSTAAGTAPAHPALVVSPEVAMTVDQMEAAYPVVPPAVLKTPSPADDKIARINEKTEILRREHAAALGGRT